MAETSIMAEIYSSPYPYPYPINAEIPRQNGNEFICHLYLQYDILNTVYYKEKDNKLFY